MGTSSCILGMLPGDVFALIADHLVWGDLTALLLASPSTRSAVLLSDKLWSSYLQKHFPAIPQARYGTAGRFLERYVDLHDKSFQCRMKQLDNEWREHLNEQCGVVAISPDRQRVVASQQAHAYCFNWQSPVDPWTLHGHTGRLTSAIFLGNDHVLTGSTDKTARLWSLGHERRDRHASLQPVKVFKEHGESVTSLGAIQNDGLGDYIVTGSADTKVRLWSVAPMRRQQSLRATLAGHGKAVTALEGGYEHCLISGSMDGKVKCWDLEKALCLNTWKMANSCKHLFKGSSGKDNLLYVVTTTSVHIIDIRLKAACANHTPGLIFSAAACGSFITLGGTSSAVVYDIRHGLCKARNTVALLGGHSGRVTEVRMDRHKIITATDKAGEGPIRVWSHAGEEYAVLSSSLGQDEGGCPDVEEGRHGVSALEVNGPVLATCSTSGNFVYRNFSTGIPYEGKRPGHIQILGFGGRMKQ